MYVYVYIYIQTYPSGADVWHVYRYMDDINRFFIADLGIFVGRDHLVGQDLLQGSLQLRKRAERVRSVSSVLGISWQNLW